MTTTKEKKAEYDKKRRQENPDYYSRKAQEWSKANREKVLLSSKKNWYKTKYGITLEEYQQKLENQKYSCAICGKHESEFARKLAVDHCHITGKIRDLLCPKCNLALGYVNEDITILENMISYAHRHALSTT